MVMKPDKVLCCNNVFGRFFGQLTVHKMCAKPCKLGAGKLRNSSNVLVELVYIH